MHLKQQKVQKIKKIKLEKLVQPIHIQQIVLRGPTPAETELATKATQPIICRGRKVCKTNETEAKQSKHMESVFKSLFAMSQTLKVKRFDRNPINNRAMGLTHEIMNALIYHKKNCPSFV
ncbi:UNKNOWN [Stylonychia lemnae]|uniref:Uncharacterized protein n=1 Tax=Stylonychia lemnae TaxID=5949 RepID=A0A077ZVC9_STYLE|nr:UNKNOWN [Stylonychia lemnae]|eukprot:CDW73594.1 UNKNOWN [Stylonychia lemnae]